MARDLPVQPEPLESRVLCSATVSMKKERMIITGTDDNPTAVRVFLTPDRKIVQVTIDGVIQDPKPNKGPPDGVKRENVKRIDVTTGAGNDTIQIDVLEEQPRRNKDRKFIARGIVYGGAGDDAIQGGPLGDVLIGGPGNDTIVGGDNNDLIFGGTGDDTLSGSFRRDNIFGQDGNDNLNGDEGTDALYGMNGDDTLLGGVDTDFLNGGPGNNNPLDGNNDPHIGATNNVQQYMDRLVHLAVPETFRRYVDL